MPNVSKIKIIPAEPLDDGAKDAMLAAAGIRKQAATVVRDGDGKVVKVEVNLPETAAANAKTKIDANTGVAVATSITDDLIPGTTGMSGDQATWDALVADPNSSWAERSAPVITDNLDGTITYGPNAGNNFSSAELRVTDSLLPYNNDSNTEIKFKFDTANTHNSLINLHALNAANHIGVTIYNGSTNYIFFNGQFLQNALPAITDANMHTLELIHEATAVSIKIDGVEQFRRTVSPFDSRNLVVFKEEAYGESITVDYLRWTENV